jgi:hypothetical protein
MQFEHRGNGPLMHCEVHGLTFLIETFWQVDLFCVNTTGDLRDFVELAWRMYMSRQTNADVVAQQQRYHAQVMAMGAQQNQFINSMTQMNSQGHNQRMHDIQARGAANTQMHEQRMMQHDVMHQSWMNNQTQFDAQQASWMNQQVSDDAQQRARVNAIREEHTAIDANGNQYQVDIHHERYYVNKRDNTYVGTGATTEWHDLRRNYGVNPDDFEEVKIVR